MGNEGGLKELHLVDGRQEPGRRGDRVPDLDELRGERCDSGGSHAEDAEVAVLATHGVVVGVFVGVFMVAGGPMHGPVAMVLAVVFAVVTVTVIGLVVMLVMGPVVGSVMPMVGLGVLSPMLVRPVVQAHVESGRSHPAREEENEAAEEGGDAQTRTIAEEASHDSGAGFKGRGALQGRRRSDPGG